MTPVQDYLRGRPRGRRSNPTWPDWLAESEQPLRDWLEEYGEIEDQATLAHLLELERRQPKPEPVDRVDFSSGDHLYTLGRTRSRWGHQSAPVSLLVPDHKGAYTLEDPEHFLADISMFGRECSYFSPDPEDQYHEDFWSSPGSFYHGSRDVEGVLASGIELRDEHRSLNDHALGPAVFATSEREVAEEYAQGPDAGVVLIDVAAMKRDGYMPRASEEPQVREGNLMQAIANKLGMDYDVQYTDSGIRDDTVVFFGPIPPRYLTRVA